MQVKGYAKNHEDLLIKGWVFQEGNPAPLVVKVYWQGKLVQSVLADGFREDLVQKQIHPEGHCGFHIFYSDFDIDLPLECSLDLKVGPDELDFPGGPIKPRFPRPYYSSDAKETFFFLHIPKTAGTSFQRMLYRIFPQKEIFPNMADLHRNHLEYLRFPEIKKLPAERLEGIRLLMGHLPAVAAQKMPPGTHILTFLREPMARSFSDINQRKSIIPSFKNLSIEDTIYEMRYALFNVQTRYLADLNLDHTPYHNHFNNLDDKGLELAKEQLKACAFFGISERFDESIALAERTFGWRFKENLRVNQAKSKVANSMSAENIAFLKKHMAYDFELYQFAMALFEKRLKKKRFFFW